MDVGTLGVNLEGESIFDDGLARSRLSEKVVAPFEMSLGARSVTGGAARKNDQEAS
jgi:hypothetical protein